MSEVDNWRNTYANEWIKRFRKEIACHVVDAGGRSNRPERYFPDITTISGPRTLGLSIYAGRYSADLRSLLLKSDMAFTRLTIPWETQLQPFVDWDGPNVLIEMPWPDVLADTSIRTMALFDSENVRRLRCGADWLIGVDQKYRPVCLSLEPSRGSPHWLLSGETQSGKTWALLSLLVQLSMFRHNLVILICVSRKSSMEPLDRLPGMVFPIAVNLDEARMGMKWAVEQIGPRLQSRNGSRLLIVIDELQTLKGDQTCTDLLKVLTSEAAEAGIHIIGATQRPVVKELGDVGGIIKSNMGGRIAFKSPDIQGSTIALGVRNAEARLNSLRGQGDAFINSSNIVPTRVQVSYFTPEEIQKVRRVPYVFAQWPDYVDRLPSQVRGKVSLSFTSEQVAIALILKARTERGNVYGRQKVMRMLEESGHPVSEHRAKKLMQYTSRIYEILKENHENEI